MRILVVGSGGREHALCWKIRQSPQLRELYCAPGNGGIAELAECVAIAADDIEGICAFAEERTIDLTVVGPELPLTLGLVDRLEARGLRAFGPRRDGAQLEGSKAFTKRLLDESGVPSARFGVFSDVDPARSMHDHDLVSIDVVEVVSRSMRELQVTVPLPELRKLRTINDLVDALHRGATLRHKGRSRNLHERLARVVQGWGYAVPLTAAVRSKR